MQHNIKDGNAIMDAPLLLHALLVDESGQLLKPLRFRDLRYDIAVLVGNDDPARDCKWLQWPGGRAAKKNCS